MFSPSLTRGCVPFFLGGASIGVTVTGFCLHSSNVGWGGLIAFIIINSLYVRSRRG